MADKLTHPKMLSVEQLIAQLAAVRAKGKRIVFTNGCFDILHPGHVDLLARARAEGDFLVLGVNSDDSVRRQNKGPERPINTCEARAFVLAHLESVDAVIAFDDDTPARLIDTVRPHVLVKGGDWPPERIVGAELVLRLGGQVLSLPLIEGYSTTGIVRRLQNEN